jgi:hypothetical protein
MANPNTAIVKKFLVQIWMTLMPSKICKGMQRNLDNELMMFIDHRCILDKQGYPIYPNGNTVFVWKPGDTVTNFGTIGFSTTSSRNKQGINNTWKVLQYFCLGALVCNNPSCQWAAPPNWKR